MLAGKNLSLSYKKQTIVSNASVQLEPGQISVIIGPSGSGKTSLLKLLALLEPADSGELFIDDHEYKFPVSQRAKIPPPWPKVSVVFQQLFLWPHLTLRQNIKLPSSLNRTNGRPEKFEQLIELFDMKKCIEQYPNQCSLGQRQRAALVRALLLEPKYLLLDEITSSLDVEQVAIILTHLRELAEGGIGILTVTHLLHFARQAADQVIFMDQGQIVESGGKEVLFHPQQERVKKFLCVIESAS